MRRRGDSKTKAKQNMTAGARAGVITDTGFIEGDRCTNNCCCEEKQSNWSLVASMWRGGGRYVSKSFPLQWSWPIHDACCCFTVFEHITKKRAGSAGSFLSPAMANTIVTTDTEVKHKTGLCHTNVLPSKLQGIKKKTTNPPSRKTTYTSCQV